MGELKTASSAPMERGAHRGPISMKGIDHLEVHPAFGGKVKIMHHYTQTGESYKSPVPKEMEPEAAAKHIAGFLGVAKEEPGGKPGETPEHEEQSKPGRSEGEEEGEE